MPSAALFLAECGRIPTEGGIAWMRRTKTDFSGQHNQNQGPPGDHQRRHSGGMTARERRYMRERRRARTRRSLLADSGAGEMRIAALRPLLAETVTLEVEQRWRVLFPDAPEVDEMGVEA